jgi:hypothetical protein
MCGCNDHAHCEDAHHAPVAGAASTPRDALWQREPDVVVTGGAGSAPLISLRRLISCTRAMLEVT